jgi:hypothetical protein
MKRLPTHKVRITIWHGSPALHVRNNTGGGTLFDIDEIKLAYEKCQDHHKWSLRLKVSKTHIRRAFELVGIDYLKDLFVTWQTGSTCAQIAQKIGMKAQDLARKFKDNGHIITRGPKRPQATTSEIESAANPEAPVVSVAKKLSVHWQTARKILIEAGLLQATEPRVPFQRYKLFAEPADTS